MTDVDDPLRPIFLRVVRRHLAATIADLRSRGPLDAGLIGEVSAATGSREKFLRKNAGVGTLTSLVGQALHRLSNIALLDLVVAVLQGPPVKPLRSAVLAVLARATASGGKDGTMADAIRDPEQTAREIFSLAETHPYDDIVLTVWLLRQWVEAALSRSSPEAVSSADGPAGGSAADPASAQRTLASWDALSDSLERMAVAKVEAQQTPPTQDPDEGTTDAPAVPDTGDPASLLGPAPQFSHFDRLLIRTAVASANEVTGALDQTALDDLVQEVIDLNEQRAQSHFHGGYVDGLRERELTPRAAVDNRERRAWRVAGHLLARFRAIPLDRVLDLLETVHPEDSELLVGRDACSGGAFLSPFVVRSALASGRVETAETWIQSHGAVTAEGFTAPVLEWSRTALLGDRPADVKRIVGALLCFESRLESAAVQQLKHRFAVALRRVGAVLEAGALVEELLSAPQSDHERQKLEGQLALIRMGVRSFEDLCVPADMETRVTQARSIESVRTLLESAEQNPEVSPAVLFALALPVVADPKARDDDRSRAIQRLERALARMQADGREHWERAGMHARCRFYLALLHLRQCSTEIASQAVSDILGVLGPGHQPAIELLIEAIELGAMASAERLDALAHAALERDPVRAIRTLSGARELMRDSAQLRAALVDALGATNALILPDERWESWEVLLRASLDARDRSAAERAMDALEDLAHEEDRLGKFEALLARDEIVEGVWNADERDEARVAIWLRRGQRALASRTIEQMAWRSLRRGDAEAAEAFVDELERLGHDREVIAALSARVSTNVAAAPDDLRNEFVRVLFVGGNETQEQYQDKIREAFRASMPNVNITFRATGWGANWGRLRPQLEAEVASNDVIVLMKFVRTNLGRFIRGTAGELAKPWIPCPGHGLESMQRAIQRSVEFEVRRRRRSRGK